jgi:hypothetical protein
MGNDLTSQEPGKTHKYSERTFLTRSPARSLMTECMHAGNKQLQQGYIETTAPLLLWICRLASGLGLRSGFAIPKLTVEVDPVYWCSFRGQQSSKAGPSQGLSQCAIRNGLLRLCAGVNEAIEETECI